MVVGLAVVLFGYLVPSLARTRQQLADSRIEDRFSGAMRVVATGGTAKRSASGDHHGRSEARPYLHDPRRRTENPAVNRSMSPAGHSAADARRLAALRAARAAEISRRQAAARRRLILTVALLVAGVAGWAAVAATTASVALGIVPTVLLAGVLVLGRRAAKAAARRNAADRAMIARLQLSPASRGDAASRRAALTAAAAARGRRVTGPGAAGRASDGAADDGAAPATATEQVPDAGQDAGPAEDIAAEEAAPSDDAAPVAAVPTDPAEPAQPDEIDDAAEAQPWTPVPVPAPAYTLKPTAPRRDIAGYVPTEAPVAAEPAATTTDASLVALEGSPYAAVAGTTAVAELPDETADAGAERGSGLDLASVLARRRAVGA